MNKLKKCMTIMALVGTVLVTGVFCYMPFRETIREANKNIVLDFIKEKLLEILWGIYDKKFSITF